MMKFVFQFAVLALMLGYAHVSGQACGQQLQDIPDPASESCVAFFRCYQYRQYALRCPLGQSFHFDQARCRPESEVDCPLQLQRFQAPFVPYHLRPPQAAHDREVEIRVVHITPNTGANGVQSGNTGKVPVTVQTNTQQQNVQPPQTSAQQHHLVYRTLDGRIVQSLPGQSLTLPGQTQYVYLPVQAQNAVTTQQNNQPAQGQIPPPTSVQYSQGQALQGQTVQGQAVQGQNLLSQQNLQGQTYQGFNTRLPQTNGQGQIVQNQNIPYTQQNGQLQSGQIQGQQVQGIPFNNQNFLSPQQNSGIVQNQVNPAQNPSPFQPALAGNLAQGQQSPSFQLNQQGQISQGQTGQGQQAPFFQINKQPQQIPPTQIINTLDVPTPSPKPTAQTKSVQDPRVKTTPTAPKTNVEYQIDQIVSLTTPAPTQRGVRDAQTNISIFSPSTTQNDQPASSSK